MRPGAGEFSWTSKEWMPLLSATDFGVSYSRKNGMRATAGLLYSPTWMDTSIYMEAGYNGDAYTGEDWTNLQT
jgi:hypothetical protein